MADIDVFEVDEREVMKFDDDLRGVFPKNGLECNVDRCSSFLRTYGKYIKHWKITHIRTIPIYRCTAGSKQFKYKREVKRHLKLAHKYTEIKIAESMSNSKAEHLQNSRFIDPKAQLLYKNRLKKFIYLNMFL